MLKIFCIALFALSVISCTTSQYIGRSYPVTTSVELFFREADISREFEIMGKASVFNSQGPEVQREIEKLAKEKGADAVLFESNDGIVTTIDKSNENVSQITTSSSSNAGNYIQVFFIKYK